MELNIYCDESGHLNYEDDKVMGFAGIECPIDKIKEINDNLREIKSDFGFSPYQELKWSKISPKNMDLYKRFINYFFIDDDLHFRAIIIKNKSKLKFTQSNTKADFYYKMLYFMIIKKLNPANKYNIYLDIKDTNSAERVANLKKFLNKTKLDYNVGNTIKNIQTIRSYESNLLQLADILLGAISYINNSHTTSNAKKILVEYIKDKSKKTLLNSTLLSEDKFNLFVSDASRMKLRGENEL